ncbi:MAG: hypothetical protein IH819_05995 [Bacteroidetes bacterium]|nr:hypothetical protein [Bacteroidota bacterium]
MNIEDSITGKIVVIMAIITAIWYIIWLIWRKTNWWTSVITSSYAQSETFEITKDQAMQKSTTALKTGRFKIKKINNESAEISARARLCLRSWGEYISITIEEKGDKSIVHFFSTSYSYVILDGGTNKRNSKRFFKELDSLVMYYGCASLIAH